MPTLPSPDTWYQRPAKYIPAEALSLYLGLDRGLQSANIGNQGLVISLGVVRVITMLFNVLYLRRIWKVARLIPSYRFNSRSGRVRVCDGWCV